MLRLTAAQDCAQTRKQLEVGKGFRQAIVCAVFQRRHGTLGTHTRCQDQDRKKAEVQPKFLHHRDTVHLGKVQIQNHYVEISAKNLESHNSRVRDFHFKAGCSQHPIEEPSQYHVVLDNKGALARETASGRLVFFYKIIDGRRGALLFVSQQTILR